MGLCQIAIDGNRAKDAVVDCYYEIQQSETAWKQSKVSWTGTSARELEFGKPLKENGKVPKTFIAAATAETVVISTDFGKKRTMTDTRGAARGFEGRLSLGGRLDARGGETRSEGHRFLGARRGEASEKVDARSRDAVHRRTLEEDGSMKMVLELTTPKEKVVITRYCVPSEPIKPPDEQPREPGEERMP